MENIQPAPIPSERKASNGKVIGLSLVVLGLLFIASRFIPFVNSLMWALAFGGAGFGTYVFASRKQSRWLMGLAYVLASVAGAITVGTLLPGEFLAAFILYSLAAPGLFFYARNRSQWLWLVPGGLFAMAGSIVLLAGVWYVLPAIFIVGGIYMLVRSNGSKQIEAPEAPQPLTGPAADK